MGRECLLALLMTIGVMAESKLYLKTRAISTSSVGQKRATASSLARVTGFGRVHMLIQFDHSPTQDDLRLLEDRQATVVGYVHQNGFVVSVVDPSALGDIALTYSAEMAEADKVSPLLSELGSSRAVVIELHPDVNMDVGRTIVLGTGAALGDNPSLRQHHLLAMATAYQVQLLASRDEVAYVFPAADALVAGSPLVVCGGAIAGGSDVGQYIAQAGDGWDGPGENAAALGYYFSQLPVRLPPDWVRSEIARAFDQWANYARVTFQPASRPDAAATINILFASGAHGDDYPFDGPGGILAHTFYPYPVGAEPLAGDMHLDDDEAWGIGVGTDVFSVALHESGHALGLGHSDNPADVMYPYYAQVTGLSAGDVAAIRALYAAQDSEGGALSLTIASMPGTSSADSITVSGRATGGTGDIVVSWQTDQGQSGTAVGSLEWSAGVPLGAGLNIITVTGTDSAGATVSKFVSVTRQADAGGVVVEFTDPDTSGLVATMKPTIDLQGTASYSSGIASVIWWSDAGFSGVASGAEAWDTGPVSLAGGMNNITVQATAIDGSIGSRTIPVMYSVKDTTAPSLKILSPGSALSRTTADSIVVKGTAADNVGVTSVTWATTGGLSGSAAGTTQWVTGKIPLIYGFNTIVIRAFDAAGNTGWRAINVTRQ